MKEQSKENLYAALRERSEYIVKHFHDIEALAGIDDALEELNRAFDMSTFSLRVEAEIGDGVRPESMLQSVAFHIAVLYLGLEASGGEIRQNTGGVVSPNTNGKGGQNTRRGSN